MHNIVYITDDNYVLPTKTSINSIVKNSDDKLRLTIYIIAIDVSDANKKALISLSTDSISIQIMEFENEFAELGLDHVTVSKAALFKFQLPYIFHDLDTILYIDGDTVIFSQFSEIFNTDLTERYVAAVIDMHSMKFGAWHEKLGHKFYFNSGMMYLNLRKMRDDKISEKLIEYKRNDTEDHFMDQNALNAVFDEKVVYLNPRFNHIDELDRVFDLPTIMDFFGVSKNDIQNPVIRHMAGGLKPWKSATADNADDWIPYVKSDDTLTVTKNWLNSLAKTESEHFTTQTTLLAQLNESYTSQAQQISALESELSAQSSKISEQSQCIAELSALIERQNARISELNGLILNTRHRTLYGACAWLFRKVFRK